RAFMDQIKQADHPRPGATALAEAFIASPSCPTIQLMTKPLQTVSLLVNRVIDRHQATGFSKQGDDAAHDDARTCNIQILVIVSLSLLLSLLDGDMGSGDQLLYSLANALTQYAGKRRLPLAGGTDGLQELALPLFGQQCVAIEQGAPDDGLGRWLTFV